MRTYIFVLGLSLVLFACGGDTPIGGQSYLIEDQAPVSVLVAPELNGVNLTNGIQLTWSDVRSEVAHVDNLIVEKRIQAASTEFTDFVTLDMDTLEYTDTSASTGTTYQYRLRLVGADEKMLHSESVSVLREARRGR